MLDMVCGCAFACVPVRMRVHISVFECVPVCWGLSSVVTKGVLPHHSPTHPPTPAGPLDGGSSEGLGAAGVGDSVGVRLLGVASVVVHLGQDGHVHAHLQQPARPELHWRLRQQEVARLESVTARPHRHHLDAGDEREGRPTQSLSQRVVSSDTINGTIWGRILRY